MARKVIGLTGKLKSGKSEAAKMLHARGFTRVRFAGPLKAMMACLGLNEDQIEGSLKERPSDLLCGKTPRFAMQTIGTEWGRNTIGSDLWINAWRHAVNSHPEFINVVSDDVRFENEVAAVRSMGGVIVRIVRDTVNVAPTHASEVMDFPVDVTIDNNGSLDDLRGKIYALLD